MKLGFTFLRFRPGQALAAEEGSGSSIRIYIEVDAGERRIIAVPKWLASAIEAVQPLLQTTDAAPPLQQERRW